MDTSTPPRLSTSTLEVIGGKWKGIILFHLLEEKRRFNEFRRLMPGVTQRMLTLQLRELERDGVVARTIYPEVPPRVEYALTPFGETLRPIIGLMRDWGQEFRDTVLKTRSTGV
jgi:DNA-binding HxlR family transcriptional regulator